LSSDDVRNRVYQFETRRYVERISQRALEFNCEDSRFRDFVHVEQRRVLQLNIVNADGWTGLIKVYQVLQNSGCLREGQHTVMELERLLKLNQLMDFSKLMLSTKAPHLILMARKDSEKLDDKTKAVIREIFNSIKDKPNIKIILSTRSDVNTVNLLAPEFDTNFSTPCMFNANNTGTKTCSTMK
jgi:hypothetical protein